jgi:Rps23 Pro-64 3,4-dihydroxylase Tpa1-like proline 4-hydroxylase
VNLSDFNEKDGGALGLFETENNHPTRVVQRYPPQFNSFVLFKVTPQSFHQVQEVLSDKQRCTITGWFHG